MATGTLTGQTIANTYKSLLKITGTTAEQIEKQVEVIKAFYHRDDETIFQESALYKMKSSSLFEERHIQNIIKDTVSIFLNLSLIPSLGVEGGIPVLRDYTTYKGLDINFRDMEFHENEAVNYSVVSRVINQLFEMQRQVLNSIREDISDPEDEEDFAGAIIVGDAEFEELNLGDGSTN